MESTRKRLVLPVPLGPVTIRTRAELVFELVQLKNRFRPLRGDAGRHNFRRVSARLRGLGRQVEVNALERRHRLAIAAAAAARRQGGRRRRRARAATSSEDETSTGEDSSSDSRSDRGPAPRTVTHTPMCAASPACS